MEATQKAQEQAQRKAEEARIAQVKAFEETAARAAAIQAKKDSKIPLFLASQMASASSEPAMAPSGPPKMAPELRAAAQVTGSELNAAKKLELEEAKKTAKADAKVASEQARMTVDVLVKAADDVMQQAQASVEALDFTQARALQAKAMEARAKKAAEVKAAEEKQIAAEKAAEEAKIAAIQKAEEECIAAEKEAEERAIAEAKAAQEANFVAEKKAEEERVAAEKAAEEARVAAHMTAGHAAVKQAEEAVASGKFEAAWAAQDAAAKQFGLGGSSSSQLSTVAALTDKIAAAELLARNAAFQKEGDAKYAAAVQSVEAEEVSAAKASLAEAAAFWTKAGVDAGAALKELKTKIEAAEVSLALREKIAAKIEKKETKKREVQARLAEEDARKEAERKGILAAEQAKRDAVKAKLLRERELIKKALAGPAGRDTEEVPELKTLARPSVSDEDLEKERMTGTEIAEAKLAEAKELVQTEKEAVKATKVQEDAMRKVAAIEGDCFFAAAEAALASGDTDAAKANEKAATATYGSRKIARTTILCKL